MHDLFRNFRFCVNLLNAESILPLVKLNEVILALANLNLGLGHMNEYVKAKEGEKMALNLNIF